MRPIDCCVLRRPRRWGQPVPTNRTGSHRQLIQLLDRGDVCAECWPTPAGRDAPQYKTILPKVNRLLYRRGNLFLSPMLSDGRSIDVQQPAAVALFSQTQSFHSLRPLRSLASRRNTNTRTHTHTHTHTKRAEEADSSIIYVFFVSKALSPFSIDETQFWRMCVGSWMAMTRNDEHSLFERGVK